MEFEDIDTHCISNDELPWLSLSRHADLVSIKLLSVDPVRGEIILVLRAPPGIELPRHRVTGPTTIYTVQGRWRFREHDWVAGPGSLVIEPATSCHTLQVPGDGTDDAILLVMATGDFQTLDANDRVVHTENWRTALDRYRQHCRANGIAPHDLTPAVSLREHHGA